MATTYKGTTYTEDFAIGDTVKTNKYFHSINSGGEYTIMDIQAGNYSHSDHFSGDMIYKMKILLNTDYGSKNWFSASNFRLVKKGNNSMANNLAIAVSRPCIVYLQEDTVNEANMVTTKRVGDPQFFDSYTAATAYTQKAIQDKIRKDNIYQKYEIYERKSVAQAKEPPVVFEVE